MMLSVLLLFYDRLHRRKIGRFAVFSREKIARKMFDFGLKKPSLDNRLNGVIKTNEKDLFDGD